jgi:hypothetical protein
MARPSGQALRHFTFEERRSFRRFHKTINPVSGRESVVGPVNMLPRLLPENGTLNITAQSRVATSFWKSFPPLFFTVTPERQEGFVQRK